MNKMSLKVSAISKNEAFVRTVVSAFMLQLNPSVEQISDVKTTVSEAVTNAIVHAYPDGKGEIYVECEVGEDYITIVISDDGIGIPCISLALEPFYTTKESEERSGLGFTIMKSFMDDFKVYSTVGKGTRLVMTKKIA